MTGANAAAIRANEPLLRQHPLLNSTFLPDGIPLVEGDILRRPLLADTLYRIAAEGSAALYSGEIADGIIEEVLSSTPWYGGGCNRPFSPFFPFFFWLVGRGSQRTSQLFTRSHTRRAVAAAQSQHSHSTVTAQSRAPGGGRSTVTAQPQHSHSTVTAQSRAPGGGRGTWCPFACRMLIGARCAPML